MIAARSIKIIAKNKKARHHYEFLEKIEAGLVLTGAEVKSLRLGQVSFQDSYVRFVGGEAFMVNVHIAPYKHAGDGQHNPDRERKLLLHSREIAKLAIKVEQKGLTVVPVMIYFNHGKVKVELCVARGSKAPDQREELKRRAVERDTAREMAKYK